MASKYLGALLAATALAGVSAATEASATSDVFVSGGQYNPGTVTINGPSGFHVDARSGPVLFDESDGQTLYAWCIDIYHSITAGLNSQHTYSPPLSYRSAPLVWDSSSGATPGTGGRMLSASQIALMGGLAAWGDHLLFSSTVTDRDNQLAALQDAIWEVEYPTSLGYSYSNIPSVVQGYIDADLMRAPADFTVTALYPVGGNTQGFMTATEPAGWALLLAGFGLVGARTRARRTARA